MATKKRGSFPRLTPERAVAKPFLISIGQGYRIISAKSMDCGERKEEEGGRGLAGKTPIYSLSKRLASIKSRPIPFCCPSVQAQAALLGREDG
jgi:hypothetical protein